MKHKDSIWMIKNLKAIKYAEMIQAILNEAEEEGIELYSRMRHGVLTMYLDDIPICTLSRC